MDEICCLHDRYGQQDTLFDLISMPFQTPLFEDRYD